MMHSFIRLEFKESRQEDIEPLDYPSISILSLAPFSSSLPSLSLVRHFSLSLLQTAILLQTVFFLFFGSILLGKGKNKEKGIKKKEEREKMNLFDLPILSGVNSSHLRPTRPYGGRLAATPLSKSLQYFFFIRLETPKW